MNFKSTISGIFLMTLFMSLSVSCVKDPLPTGGDTVNGSSGPTLQFTITKGSDPLIDAQVNLSSTRADRDNGIFFASRTTGSSGIVKFEGLSETTYWHSVRGTISGSILLRNGEYNFVPGQNGNVNIQF